MADYKSTRTLILEAAAYIASLVDGEGTITHSRRHANEHRQLVESIANTELALLRYASRLAPEKSLANGPRSAGNTGSSMNKLPSYPHQHGVAGRYRAEF